MFVFSIITIKELVWNIFFLKNLKHSKGVIEKASALREHRGFMTTKKGILFVVVVIFAALVTGVFNILIVDFPIFIAARR